jgi:hypothetical protein
MRSLNQEAQNNLVILHLIPTEKYFCALEPEDMKPILEAKTRDFEESQGQCMGP